MEPRAPIRAVVFDLDGLMFDTEALFVRVAGELLAARGKAFTPEIMGAMIGRQAAVAYPALKALAGLDETAVALQAEIRTRFTDLIDAAVHPTPGLFVLLDHLHKAGLPAAVGTSSRREYAERLLRRHGIFDRLAFLLTAEDVARSKPDPEVFLTAAARFGLPPASVLVLEDSPPGIAAARAAGAFAVGVPHDHSPAAGLAAADLIVPRLDAPALLELLERGDPG